jgi:preprotein translocase subunit SecF
MNSYLDLSFFAICFFGSVVLGTNFGIIHKAAGSVTRYHASVNTVLLVCFIVFLILVVGDTFMRYLFAVTTVGFVVGYWLGLLVLGLCVISATRTDTQE